MIMVSLQFLNATFKFITNFMDTFIILVSIGLSQRFRQFAKRVLRLEKSVGSPKTDLNTSFSNTLYCSMFLTPCGMSYACITFFCVTFWSWLIPNCRILYCFPA